VVVVVCERPVVVVVCERPVVVCSGGGYLWVTWWQGVLTVVEGGGWGMKQEDVSQYVTCVTSRSTRVRSRSRPNFCSVPYIHRFVVYRDRFVVSIVQFCGDHYIIL